MILNTKIALFHNLRECKTLGILLICFVFLVACKDNGGDTTNDTLSNPTSTTDKILVSAEAVFLSEIGGTYQLKARLVNDNGVALTTQPTFEWSSDLVTIASVDQTGKITAVALGDANIKIVAGDVSQVVEVTVNTEISTISATVRYADKEYGSAGFTNRTDYFKAVRFAKVDLIDENGLDILQTTHTDADGKFTFNGVLTSQQTISVYAQTDISLGLDIRVADRSNGLYAVSKAVDVSTLENFTMDVLAGNKAAGAFNILDVFTNAALFTMENSDATQVTLAGFWQKNNSAGTYYCTGYDGTYCLQGAGVYIYNAINGDTDEFDDDVLYHEFAHYFSQTLSRDDSLGGCHLLSSRDLDLRLAWSEGWGDFLPSGIKAWLSDPSRSHLLSTADTLPVTAYVDTYANTAQIFIDMATMSQDRYSSAANEMAVAKILWSLSQRYGMPDIVKVLTNYLPSIGSTPVNLESFWDGWLNEHNPSSADLVLLESIFEERRVYYREDEFEGDGTISNLRKINIGQTETHYLYSDDAVTDLDFVAFDVQGGQQYTLQTSGLTSGADTYVRVLKGADIPLTVSGALVENDDIDETAYYSYDSICGSTRVKNNATALASKLTFTAPSTGTYYAEIRTTVDPEPYLSAGRYGTYDFTVKQN